MRTGPCEKTLPRESRGYRYYVCVNAQKRGWANCPSKSVPAAEIERFVVEQIREVGRDPALVAETLAQVRAHVDASLEALRTEQRGIEQDVRQAADELRRLAGAEAIDTARLADLNERVRLGEQRLREIADETGRLKTEVVDEGDVAQALGAFAPVWEHLSPKEQARVLGLLIERVDYNGEDGTVSVTFRPSGIRALGQQLQIEEAEA